jgi:hypothetical protein
MIAKITDSAAGAVDREFVYISIEPKPYWLADPIGDY